MPSADQGSSKPELPTAQQSRGERKFVVSLFADLSGYTALCQRLDPEDVELTIAPLMASLRATVEHEGGVIANVAGDGFFAIFGVPRAYADAGNRAVRAGARMRDLVAERNAQPGLHRVPEVHVGIAAGEVLVSPSDDALGWSVIGRAINLASRLCDAAGPGEVLADNETQRLVGAASAWSGTRLIDVQGHDEPVEVWELKAVEVVTTTRHSDIPFAGRADVLARLSDTWTAVQDAAVSRVLTIDGDPGIGKSRVIRHWLDQNRGADSLWLWSGGTVGSQSILRLIDLLVGRTGEPTADVRALLEAPSHAPAAVIGAERFPMVLETTRRLLARATTASPLVLVIDDLHAADPTLHDAVADLRDRPIDARLLIVCTRRTGELAGAEADIHLEPLSPADTESLFAAALGAAPPDSVRNAVLSRIDGHPLMALQSAAYLIESGVVTVSADGCEVRSPEAVDVLPTSLRLYVSARLDALPANEKTFIQEFSTVGDAASVGWIRAVFGKTTDSMLEATATRGLLAKNDDGHWRLAHGLVQEVAYASLTRRARADLHRRQLGSLPDDDQLELRTYHAVGWAQSIGAIGPASDAAAAVAALRETVSLARVYATTQARSAQDLIQRNRAIVQEAFSTTPELAVQLLTLNAQCLVELGRFDEALQSTTQADDLSGEYGVEAETRLRCLLARGHALSRLRRFQSARQALDDANALAEQIANDSLRAQSLVLIADTWRHSDYPRYLSLTEDAYEVFVASGDLEGAGECARHLAYLLSVGSVARYERWAALARSTTTDDDVRAQTWLACGAQHAFQARFEFEQAEIEADRAIEYGGRAGIQHVVTDGLSILIDSTTALGKSGAAVEAATRMIELADRQNDPRARLAAAAVSAPALLRAGRVEWADEEIAIARSQLDGFGASEVYQVTAAEAVIARDRGEWDTAANGFVEVTKVAEESGAALFFVAARLELARALLEGERPVPPADLERLGEQSLELGAPLIKSMVDALLDRAKLQEGTLTSPSSPAPGACLEDLAIRADTAALLVETAAPAGDEWRAALAAWSRLGTTIFLARAQARSGDMTTAADTLTALHASDAARRWALAVPRR